MGQILRIKLVDRLLKAIYPFKRPNSLLEGAHCTKLKQLEGVRVIFFNYQLPKAIYPLKRPKSLLEGAHCTKLKRLEGVGVIFFCCRVEMNMSW